MHITKCSWFFYSVENAVVFLLFWSLHTSRNCITFPQVVDLSTGCQHVIYCIYLYIIASTVYTVYYSIYCIYLYIIASNAAHNVSSTVWMHYWIEAKLTCSYSRLVFELPQFSVPKSQLLYRFLLLEVSGCSVGWSDFWKKKLDTCHVVPNCYMTSIPKFHLVLLITLGFGSVSLTPHPFNMPVVLVGFLEPDVTPCTWLYPDSGKLESPW